MLDQAKTVDKNKANIKIIILIKKNKKINYTNRGKTEKLKQK